MTPDEKEAGASKGLPDWNWTFVIPSTGYVIDDPALFPPHIARDHFAPIGTTVPVLKSVDLQGLVPMQFDCECDYCRGPIKAGETVMGKGLNMEAGTMVGGGSSFTCMACVDKMPEWLSWLVMET